MSKFLKASICALALLGQACTETTESPSQKQLRSTIGNNLSVGTLGKSGYGSIADVYEITPPSRPDMRCLVVRVNDEGSSMSCYSATVPQLTPGQ